MGSLDISRNLARTQQQSRVQQQHSPQRAQQSHASRPQHRSSHPAVRAYQGANTFEGPPSARAARATSAPTGPIQATHPGGSGSTRSARGYQDTDVDKLRDALPSQAKHLAQTFVDAAKKNNLDPAVLVGMSQHETGNWTSSAFKNKNNAMGVMGSSKSTLRFGSHEQSIDYMAHKLSDPQGYYKNAQTVGQVGAVYAPVGAANDPRNLNSEWVKDVARNADQWADKIRPTPPAAPTEIPAI
jgi:hypothetical protein